MNAFLDGINVETINSHIEKNLDDFYIKASEHPNFISRIEDKISWVLARTADWPDCIFRADFENLNIKKEIKNIKKLIQKGKAPNGWTIGPLTKPKNIGKFLEKFGFSNVYQQAGMAVKLKNIKNKEIKKNELIIEKVENEESLVQWSKTVSQVFGLKIDFEFLKFLLLQEEVHFYLGKFEGNPTSTLMLYISSGVAGLHAVSTLPEYRNKGFGLTISRTALIDAFNIGYRVGVLQASSLGESVYRKLGFQKYCDIISYALEKE
ncbi:MAG: GNAT family N-acetyltransferase [Candidatus Hermodarchaeota archaeon]